MMTDAPDIDTLLLQPRYMLHRIDPVAATLTLLPTHRTTLEAASFIDGRTPLASGEVLTLPIDAALGTHVDWGPAADRLIFHMGFCGSTLLARLLDTPGQVFVYKEPNALADLANWQARLAESGQTDARLPALLRLTLSKMRQPWAPGEISVIKPSNWVNNLLPLLADDAQLQALYVTIDVEAFVTAIFRGGRDRIAFAARALVHMATALPALQTLVAEATIGGAQPFEKIARLAALLHAVQLRLFGNLRVDFATITTDPASACAAARVALDLPVARDDPTFTDRLLRNAKAPEYSYVAADHDRADAAVMASYGAYITSGLEWANTALRQIS